MISTCSAPGLIDAYEVFRDDIGVVRDHDLAALPRASEGDMGRKNYTGVSHPARDKWHNGAAPGNDRWYRMSRPAL